MLQLKVWACTKTHPRRNKTQFAQQRLTKSTEEQVPHTARMICSTSTYARWSSQGELPLSVAVLVSSLSPVWSGEERVFYSSPHPQTSQPRAYCTHGSWPGPTATVTAAERGMERGKRDEIRKEARNKYQSLRRDFKGRETKWELGKMQGRDKGAPKCVQIKGRCWDSFELCHMQDLWFPPVQAESTRPWCS